MVTDFDGKIEWLIDQPAEEWEALQADIARCGFTIEDIPHRLSWTAVAALATHSPEGSALHQVQRRERLGEQAEWPVDRHFAVMTYDALRQLNHNLAKLSGAKPGSFVPYPRPGVGAQTAATSADESNPFKRQTETTQNGQTTKVQISQQVGSDPIAAIDFAAWWADPGGMEAKSKEKGVP